MCRYLNEKKTSKNGLSIVDVDVEHPLPLAAISRQRFRQRYGHDEGKQRLIFVSSPHTHTHTFTTHTRSYYVSRVTHVFLHVHSNILCLLFLRTSARCLTRLAKICARHLDIIERVTKTGRQSCHEFLLWPLHQLFWQNHSATIGAAPQDLSLEVRFGRQRDNGKMCRMMVTRSEEEGGRL